MSSNPQNPSASSSSNSASSSSSHSASRPRTTSHPVRHPDSMPSIKPKLAKQREMMQDRQARGKDVMTGKPPGVKDDREARVDHEWDSYEAKERRRWAATVLDTPELLSMWAEARNDSVPGTRYYFTKIMAGYED